MQSSRAVYAAVLVGAMVFAIAPGQAAPIQKLANHVPRAIHESRHVGAMSDTATLNCAIGLPLRNSDELEQVLADIADPQSANYRQYLSASEFADRFGPTQQDYDKLIDFVQQHGLVVSGTHPNRMLLDVTGPIRAINTMLHMSLTVWDHPTRGRFYAPDRDPTLDTDVQILDITGLDNFVMPRPMDLKMTPLSTPMPLVTGSGPSGLFLGKDFRAAYAPGVLMTGAGQTIGLVEFDGFYAGDVAANFRQAGLPAVSVSTVLLDGFNGSPGGANIEVILDIAMAGYMAPGANIIVYEGYYPNDVLNRMATDNSSKQLSCSWGYGINSTTEQIFKQMIAQGQSFFTASGDSGAYRGGVMTPADDPNVTSVGGTALTTTGPGGTWLSESSWSGSGGGVSTTYPIPSYQQSMNMGAQGGSNTMRNLPDVALTGAVQMYLIYNNGQPTAVGGTSAATPLWAAFTALVNQQALANSKSVVGFLNPAIYAIGNASGLSAALHDITTGSNGFAAIPGFDLTTGWGSPTGQALINTLSSMPTAPSFTLSATPNPASVQASSNTTSTIQMNAQNGFSSTVTLSLSGLPSGVTGTFGPFSAGKASVLTLTASSAVVPGTYFPLVNGVSGAVSANAHLSLVVTGAPSYTMTTSASALAMVQGSSASAPITIAPANGFTGIVNLTVSGLPTGVTATFAPATTATTSTLNFAASASAVAGTAALTVTGKSGTLTSTVAIALTVSTPASFSLATSTPTLSVTQGASATSTITVTPKAGFTGKVTMTTSALPAGVTVSFNPVSTATTTVATFTATSAAAPGTSAVVVTGTLGSTSASVNVSLTVNAGANFTLAAAPATLSVTQGLSGTSAIAVIPVNGFTGTPMLTIAGLPTGVTAVFTGTALKLSAAVSAVVGPATLTITGTSGMITAQTTLALTIAAVPSFKLNTSVLGLTVAMGAAGSTTISVAPQTGFSGAVALTTTGLPAGVTASFSPATTASSSTMTLLVASSAIAKISQFVINGTSGALTATAPFTITVTPPPDFAIALVPASLRIMQGGKGSTAISLTPLYGFTGTPILSLSGLPSGVTGSITAISPQLALGLFTVSGTAAAGSFPVNVTATSGVLSHASVLSLVVVAPSAASAVVDLSASYNVPANAVDNLPFTGGGLDAGGRSYSGQLLGASQSVGGTLFEIGPMGWPDAVSGQTVALPSGQFTSLKMLATGLNGNQLVQKFTVTYTDGSTTLFTQNMSDWFTPQNYIAETQAMALPYRDNSTGTTDGEPFYLYGYSFSLNGAKTLKSITLPQNRNVVVMAITLTGSAAVTAAAQVDLSKAFNGVGIRSDGKVFTGGLDGVGNVYSGSLLQGSQTLNNVLFSIGVADQNNVVSGVTGAVALPAGSYSSLQVLATGVNGPQLSQSFKVTYSDGTSATFTQSLSDWFTPAGYSGELTALSMAYRNFASGVKDNRKFSLYQYTFNLTSGKTVSSVTLPANSNVKVFAMTLKP